MTQVASPDTVVADFDNVTVVHVHGRPMTLERRGREFWATFDDPDAEAPAAAPDPCRRECGDGFGVSRRIKRQRAAALRLTPDEAAC